jgi:aminoglycoside 6-adenylyltransferase
LIQWAERQPAVRAMLLTSNRAVPGAPVDALSDYDVVLVVQGIHPFFEERAWLEHFGPVLLVYWDPIYRAPGTGIEVTANVTQYADGLKIDFTLWPVELLQRIAQDAALTPELDAGYLVLQDKDVLTEGMPAPSYRGYVPVPPTDEEFQTWVSDFWSDPPYVAKCLWRDELLPAKWCLDTDMKHRYLRQMLEWRVECDHGWSVPVGALGKGLKRRLPPEIWAQLEESFVGADGADNWEALFNTMALFRRVAIEVAEHLGYVYPHELDERVSAYVRQVQTLDRGTAGLTTVGRGNRC